MSNSDSTYDGEIRRAMTWLAEEHDAVFLGQAVQFPGTAMTGTLSGVQDDKKMEMPVAEDMQMGISIGLSLAGALPVSIFPRWNFFLLATNQLVNHLDKIPEFSDYNPRLIIRVGIGSTNPLDPGPQHSGDLTDVFKALCDNVYIRRLEVVSEIMMEYEMAVERIKSTIFVEHMDRYGS